MKVELIDGHANEVTRAFGVGLERHGVEVDFKFKGWPSHKIHSVMWGQRDHVFAPLAICIEAGYLLRSGLPKFENRYSASLGLVNQCPNVVTDFCFDRLSEMRDRYFDLLPGFVNRNNDSKTVLVLGLVPGSASTPFSSIEAYFNWSKNRMMEDVQKVVYRPHPMGPKEAAQHWYTDSCDTIEKSLAVHRPSQVICYNGSGGARALMDGYNVTCSEDCWYHGMDCLKAGVLAAGNSFTLDEFANGFAWDHIKQHWSNEHEISHLSNS